MSVKRNDEASVDWKGNVDEYIRTFFENVGTEQQWQASQ